MGSVHMAAQRCSERFPTQLNITQIVAQGRKKKWKILCEQTSMDWIYNNRLIQVMQCHMLNLSKL